MVSFQTSPEQENPGIKRIDLFPLPLIFTEKDGVVVANVDVHKAAKRLDRKNSFFIVLVFISL
jgi:hypothetical protein